MSLRLRNHSSPCRIYLFWLLPIKKDPMTDLSDQEIKTSLGFLTKILEAYLVGQINRSDRTNMSISMRPSEDRSGPLATCIDNTGRSPVLTGELVPVDWHGLPVQTCPH